MSSRWSLDRDNSGFDIVSDDVDGGTAQNGDDEGGLTNLEHLDLVADDVDDDDNDDDVDDVDDDEGGLTNLEHLDLVAGPQIRGIQSRLQPICPPKSKHRLPSFRASLNSPFSLFFKTSLS